eukprot:3865105-Rhodomonas_salina.1
MGLKGGARTHRSGTTRCKGPRLGQFCFVLFLCHSMQSSPKQSQLRAQRAGLLLVLLRKLTMVTSSEAGGTRGTRVPRYPGYGVPS